MKLMKSLFNSLALLGLIGVLITVPGVERAQADVVGETECFPAVLMLKGSGEGIHDGEPVTPREYYKSDDISNTLVSTNGHEGNVLSKLLEAFVNETNPADTVSKVRFIGIEYPALPVFPEFVEGEDVSVYTLNAAIGISHVIQYDASYRAGAQMTLDFIREDQQRGCETQYMLLSYSQGVISARLAMNLVNNETDKIISSYVVGDPFQKANAAVAPRQITLANTSSGTHGVGRDLGFRMELAKSYLQYQFPILENTIDGQFESIEKYINDITRSDDFIYKDEGVNGVVSRSLCHEFDITCGYSGGDTSEEEHVNYFEPATAAGSVDLAHEVEEFDKQVRMLANSVTANPRERVLTNTLSIEGESTTYNVANARVDDMCHWDVNSDGSVDHVDVCGVYNATHGPGIIRMTVTVIDSFGVQHVLSTVSETREKPQLAEAIMALEPHTWYQFQPYQAPASWEGREGLPCLDWYQDYDDVVNHSGASFFITEGCKNDGYYPEPYSATQVFRQAGNYLVWGYHDGFTMDIHPEGNAATLTEIVDGVDDVDDTPHMHVRLARYEDGVSYYNIKRVDQCLSWETGNQDLWFSDCDSSNLSQLFLPTAIPGDFGKWSIEQDIVAPTPATELHVEVTEYGPELKWEDSVDRNGPYVNYEIYKDGVLVETQGWAGYSLPDNEGATYTVVAVDYAGNFSTSSTVTFGSLSSVLNSVPPPAPTLVEVDDESKTATISFENYGNSNARVMIWSDYEYLTTQSSSDVYVSGHVSAFSNEMLAFSYKLEVAPNVYTSLSDSLEVWLGE